MSALELTVPPLAQVAVFGALMWLAARAVPALLRSGMGDRCLRDPALKGRTVERGGIGG